VEAPRAERRLGSARTFFFRARTASKITCGAPKRGCARSTLPLFSAQLREARARTLDRLHEYTATQECPLNETQSRRVPVMIDSAGRHCPVAALMAMDGEDPYVKEVARTANNVWVRDIGDSRFLSWAAESGSPSMSWRRFNPPTRRCRAGRWW